MCSNAPFWLIYNPASKLILLIRRPNVNKFLFCMLLLFFFCLFLHSDDSRAISVTFFWFKLADSVLGFSVLTERVSWRTSFLLLPIPRPFKNIWNAIHIKVFWILLRLLSCDLKKVDVVGLSRMDNHSSEIKNESLWAHFLLFREILGLF